MSLNFYERFKDRMNSISKHGIQELKRPSMTEIHQRAILLPPIRPMQRPQKGCTTTKTQQAVSEDRRIDAKSQHISSNVKFKKTQGDLPNSN